MSREAIGFDNSHIQNKIKMLYTTNGTCSKAISFDINPDGTVHNIKFFGGCPGNTVGVCALAEGQTAESIIERLEGITCGNKPTSCPDQLAKALRANI